MRGARIAELMSAAVARRTITVDVDVALRDLLVRSGAAALAWFASRDESLRDSYRQQVLRTAIAEQQLERLALAIEVAGLRPILGKGWAVARAYPDPALRPYGDFDLYASPDEYERLRDVVASTPLDLFGVDVHRGASYLDDRSFADVHARALILPIGSATMRVFAAEDQLRLVCIHALAEGMIRPPWLCDIAMLVQSADATFDWEWFRSGDSRRTEYALAALGLAQQLLGITLPIDVPTPPRWLARAVLRVWGSGPLAKGSRMTFADARKGGRTVRALIDRWPNPIEATIGMNGAINAMPRLPYQLAEVVRRMRVFISR